jgi:hypothetical protein
VNASFKRELAAKGIRNPHNRADCTPNPSRGERKVSTHRLLERLGLAEYDRHAPFRDVKSEPCSVTIPLCQHLGAPALPVIADGARVRAGDLIGEIPEGKLGARVHGSIDGFATVRGQSVTITRG